MVPEIRASSGPQGGVRRARGFPLSNTQTLGSHADGKLLNLGGWTRVSCLDRTFLLWLDGQHVNWVVSRR